MVEEDLSPTVETGAHFFRLVSRRLVQPFAHVLGHLFNAWFAIQSELPMPLQYMHEVSYRDEWLRET